MDLTKLDSSKDISKNTAFKFILLMGITSLFADMTYEGARSITGPYLAELGANAAIVGFAAGFGEFVGFALRFVSGYLVDRTRLYWTIAFIGYSINLFAVPLLAFAGHWQTAVALIVLERLGKAVRVPARDAMLSYAGSKVGVGKAFGVHEALDKTGGMLGPLIVAGILFFQNFSFQNFSFQNTSSNSNQFASVSHFSNDFHFFDGYRFAFALLLIPAIFSFFTLFISQKLYPKPEDLEVKPLNLEAKGMDKRFWIYLTACMLIAAGYADFPLIAYHFVKKSILSDFYIPLSYAIAMGIAALSALIFGRLFDRFGLSLLIISTFFSAFFALFAFSDAGALIAFIGVVLWSIGLGTQGALMRAVVAQSVPAKKRGSAFGVFNMAFGLAWFLGSFLMGILYDIHIHWLIIFSVGAQILALPLLWAIRQQDDKTIK